MRRRVAESFVAPAIPPEFTIGRCVEVWGERAPSLHDGQGIPVAVVRIFSQAWKTYALSASINPLDMYRLVYSGRPYMARAPTQSAAIANRFAAAGVMLSDIPQLRIAALQWSADPPPF